MTNPDYRALCANLTAALHDWQCQTDDDRYADLIARARALLVQPEPEGPTNDELLRLAREWNSGFESIELHFAADFARAALARYGRPTPQPPADGEVAELCAWLRNNSSGLYRPAARAADLLERLASDNAGLEAAADSLWADNVSLLDNCHD